jgi:predicted dehydrogenase
MKPRNSRVRLGLIGGAHQGGDHLRAAANAKLAAIVAICDVAQSVRESLRSEYATLPVYEKIAGMVANEQLDGLVLALPHNVYPGVLREIAHFGLPMLKEKPLGRNLAEARAFLQTVEEGGGHIVTAVQRRAHPTYKRLAEFIRDEPLRINSIRAVLHLGFDPRATPREWRGDAGKAGGGALLDSGYHMVDLVHSLVGTMNLMHASMWACDVPGCAATLETDAVLIGRAGPTWIRIESKVGGRPDPSRRSGFGKFEEVTLDTNSGVWRADRERVTQNGEERFCCDQSWLPAMAGQLDEFARRIRSGFYDGTDVWQQLPTMRVIEEAYARARVYAHIHSTNEEFRP